MNAKIKILSTALISSLLFCGVASSQSVTLEINTGNFTNEDLVVTNGMPWGILIDTEGDGFDFGSSTLDPFALPGDGNGAFLSFGGSQSTLYFHQVNETLETLVPIRPDDGYMTVANTVPINDGSSNNVSTGDSWALMWFTSTSNPGELGTSFGFLDVGETLPAEGSTVDFSGSVDPSGSQFYAIPEPSTYAAIFGLGVLGFVVLRRKFTK
ncbi:MAG: PEP-CTERM sorting domain-containing protein [Opitutales bacterium]|nr:PEP-CTERM sorting domain-containing protein [Opitutales bacterium]